MRREPSTDGVGEVVKRRCTCERLWGRFVGGPGCACQRMPPVRLLRRAGPRRNQRPDPRVPEEVVTLSAAAAGQRHDVAGCHRERRVDEARAQLTAAAESRDFWGDDLSPACPVFRGKLACRSSIDASHGLADVIDGPGRRERRHAISGWIWAVFRGKLARCNAQFSVSEGRSFGQRRISWRPVPGVGRSRGPSAPRSSPHD